MLTSGTTQAAGAAPIQHSVERIVNGTLDRINHLRSLFARAKSTITTSTEKKGMVLENCGLSPR